MDREKIDLNAPAFGAGAQKLEETTDETVVEPVEPKENEVTSEEETKVPYSRFQKFHNLAREKEAEAEQYKREAAEWRAKAETFKPQESTDELPEFWKELYGESEASKKAWKIQQRANESLKEEARREAVEAFRNERFEETQRTEQNVEVIDNHFEDLSAFVGRDLTEKEQSAVLDIVDDYTPKDRNGNYSGELMSFDKAWEILELRNQSAKTAKTKSRDQVASLNGTQSQGDPSASAEQNKNFNPLDWDSYKRRLGLG